MDVLIAGAGIGGLALARGLLAEGHQVRVRERDGALRTGGGAVTIFSNGAAALAGLGAPADGLGGLIDELAMLRGDGTVLGRFDLRVMRRRTGFPVVTVPRDRLLHHLAAGLPAGVVQFNRPVSTVDTDGAQVLVGADGYRSTVRRATLDDGDPRGTGWITWQGLSRVLPELAGGTHARCLVDPAGFCGLMPAGNGLVQWWFDAPEAAIDHNGQSIVEQLRRRFGHFADPVPELLDAVTDAEVGRYPHVVSTVPERWGSGPTTLLGDAAHVFPPSQAQGANQALEDAWLLTRALGRPGDPVEWLRRYERRRVPRVRRVSRMAASELTLRPPNLAGRVAGRLMTPAIAGRAYLSLIRRFSSVLNNERP